MYMYFTVHTHSSHHAWCSFEAFAEIYNEMVREYYLDNGMKTAAYVKQNWTFNLQGIGTIWNCYKLYLQRTVNVHIYPMSLAEKLWLKHFGQRELNQN